MSNEKIFFTPPNIMVNESKCEIHNLNMMEMIRLKGNIIELTFPHHCSELVFNSTENALAFYNLIYNWITNGGGE